MIISPQKACGRGLVSVCGHLYGGHKIDELTDLYHYVLKVTILMSIITTVIFFFIRDYAFALFSVTGVPESIFYIALAGIIIVPFNEVSVMSEKMLETLLAPIFKNGVCVLLGILIGEVTFAIAYYILLRYLLNKSKKNIPSGAGS